MPWVETLPSGRYRAVWRDAAGRKRSKAGFTKKPAALRYAGEQESKAGRGEVSYQGRSITWGQWQPIWLELRRVENTTEGSDAARLKRWVEPRWGTVPLMRIEHEDVQRWVNELDELMAPASVAKVYHLLSSSLRSAVKMKRLAVSPCHDIELPTVPPSDERFFTRDEIDAVLHHMIEPYRSAVIILVGTGMRYGEMAGLHRHRIAWDAAAIDVHETWDGTGVKPYPKGRKKRRVPMASWVGEAIAALPDLGEQTCGLPHARGSRCRSGLVLLGPRGAPLNARNMLRRHWGDALRRAGLEHARQHDLRHTFCSWMAQAGRSMTEIAEVVGHSETTVTARYSHLGGTHMDAVRAVLEQRPIAAAPKPPAPSLPHKLRLVVG